MKVIVAGTPVEVDEGANGATALAAAELKTGAVAVYADGAVRDLLRPVAEGEAIEPVLAGSKDGLDVLRHSAAHVMAQAVTELFPGAKVSIGPAIADGFYYDFGVEKPFTPDDLAAIEKKMSDIIRQKQRIRRRVVSREEAAEIFADQPYKLQILDRAAAGDLSHEESWDAAGPEITVYENTVQDKVTFVDLCRGPHLPDTGRIAAFKVMRSSSAYWRGDEKNEQLQRVYGTAFDTKDALKAHLHFLEEAEKRDHRKLGAELDLFSFPDEIGSGLAVFHPRGGIIRRVMEDYSRRKHEEAGYSFVNTPHITKGPLFEISGHLQWYAEGMFPPMQLDASGDRPGADYYLKPMNCPMHNLIFRSRGRSYRELPLRLFEFGTVYRYEKSGVLHGLARGRGFTQDDAHIYCTREQMTVELTRTLDFVLDLLRDYGLNDFYLELSTRDGGEKFVGSDDAWETATAALQEVADASGLELVPDPGGAAFYGPKISVQARDAIGRTWQMSTIQVDFNLPERFELEYTASDGSRQRPVMIHRALFGSIERFFAVLVEHYAGAFPAWLAPVQVIGIPVAEAFVPYLDEVAGRLRARGVRIDVDASDDRMQKKIRTAQKSKVPFMLIAGGEDAEAGAVSFRFRDGTQRNGVPVDEAIALILEAIETRADQPVGTESAPTP